MHKRGLSEVIVSIIMVLLVLVAIGIVWVVVKNVLSSGTEQSTIDKINVRLKIEKVVLGENQINITLKRSAGSGEFSGIKFVFTDGINSEIIVLDEILRQLEEKMFALTLTELDVSNITEISVVPVLTTHSGKKLDGLKNNYVVRVVPSIINNGENGGGDGGTKSCSEQNGKICSSSEDCEGNWISSSDSSKCCEGECKILTITTEEISPFGINAAFDPNTLTTISTSDKITWAGEKFRDIGAKWTKTGGENIIWGLIEPEFGKGYNWSSLDEVLKKAYENGGGNFNTVGVINPQRVKGGNSDILSDKENYFSNFVEALVERYDGDGFADYDSNIKVKYWQMANEPFPNHWENAGGTIEGYLRFAELTHNAIKKSDPTAKIILGTFQFQTEEQIDKLNEVISNPSIKNKNLFDYADTHFWTSGNDYKIPLSDAKKIFDDNGYSDIGYVSLEFGTTARGAKEKNQANYLIKGFVSNIAQGFDLINWNNLVEWNAYGGKSDTIYNYMGLIADGENGDPVSAGTPRLSYYTYKKMTETLEGSDWSNIQKINESNGIYVYKFTEDSKPIWVAWNDNSNDVEITISGITSSQVKIIEAVPNYEYGKNVTNYNTAFYNYTKIVSENKAIITLEDVPVFVEEN